MEAMYADTVSESLRALQRLKEGNERFINDVRINRDLLGEMEQTKSGQNPYAVVISCMDSRTSPELIFDQGLGDIFSIRIAGNVITPEILGSAEYACRVVGTKLIVVLGHKGCGAIQGAVDNVKLGHLPKITDRIRFHVHKKSTIDEVTMDNVRAGMLSLRNESEVLGEMVEGNDLIIAGGIYDISNGKVSFIDA